MGLHQNGFRDNIGVFRFAGAGFSNGAYPSSLPINTHLTGAQRNLTAGEGIADDKAGIPQGALAPVAWVMPQKAGGLSSHNLARGSGTATLSMASGWNLEGLSEGLSEALATLQLVVSMQGTAAGVATVTGNILAALGMSGTAAGVATNNATVNALAWGVGTAAGTSTATLTSYATGKLTGTTEESGLTVAGITNSVWNAAAASYNTSGTMGEKLNGAGSAGNPWTEVIESGLTAAEVMRILAAAMAGKVSGAGTGTETFKGLDGTTDRIVSTVDTNGNRTAVTVDGA